MIEDIMYRQILTRAGFKIERIDETRKLRGSGTRVVGSFTRWGQPATEVLVKVTAEGVEIDGQLHRVTSEHDGTFALSVAHADRPA